MIKKLVSFLRNFAFVRYIKAIKLPKDIALIVYDFDGVMTDNRVFVDQNGIEQVRVSRSDGLGVDMIRKLGFHQIILSTETNFVVKARAAKISIEAITGCDDKKIRLREYCEKKGIRLKEVIYFGNDLNDMGVMKIVGYAVAPSDAHRKIKEISHLVTRSKGGDGVIREFADIMAVKAKFEDG